MNASVVFFKILRHILGFLSRYSLAIATFIATVYVFAYTSGYSAGCALILVPKLNAQNLPRPFFDAEGAALIATNEIHHELPAPFPVFKEMSAPAPQDDRLKIVFTAYPEDDTVVLFAQGLDESDVKFCVQDGHQIEVLSFKKNIIYPDCCIVKITCRRDARWQVRAGFAARLRWRRGGTT